MRYFQVEISSDFGEMLFIYLVRFIRRHKKTS